MNTHVDPGHEIIKLPSLTMYCIVKKLC